MPKIMVRVVLFDVHYAATKTEADGIEFSVDV